MLVLIRLKENQIQEQSVNISFTLILKETFKW